MAMTFEDLIQAGIQLAKTDFPNDLEEEVVKDFLSKLFLKVPISGLSAPGAPPKARKEIPEDQLCTATKKDGFRCTKKAVEDGMCKQHANMTTDGRCSHIVKRKNGNTSPCGAPAVSGSSFCKTHNKASSTEEKVKCAARTRKDEPCKKNATEGSEYCAVHLKMEQSKSEPEEPSSEAEEEPEAKPKVETVQICGRKNPKSGAVCKRPITKNGRCDFHQE